MSLFIGEGAMSSSATSHTATRTPDGGWQVSWLPGRTLDRNEAITALSLADLVGQAADGPVPLWQPASRVQSLLARSWATELGLSVEDAVEAAGNTAADVEDVARVGQEYADDVEAALQVAGDDDVAYGPTGDLELTRDPYEVLAAHGARAEDVAEADEGWGT